MWGVGGHRGVSGSSQGAAEAERRRWLLFCFFLRTCPFRYRVTLASGFTRGLKCTLDTSMPMSLDNTTRAAKERVAGVHRATCLQGLQIPTQHPPGPMQLFRVRVREQQAQVPFPK
jgi:hypothetical protein